MNPMGAMNPPAGNTAVFQLRSMLQAAQQILIAFPESTDEDATAAALAMYLILKKIRKSVTVASAGQVAALVWLNHSGENHKSTGNPNETDSTSKVN